MSCQLTGSTLPLFDAGRATDLPYCLEYMKARIASYNVGKDNTRAHIQLHQYDHEKNGLLFGVVDMMFAVGDYYARKNAKDVWYKWKRSFENANTAASGSRVNTTDGNTGVRFWVEGDFYGKTMDFCSIADFLANVLPHIGGPVADTIKKARGFAATLVSTGSKMAVALTEANAESSRTAAPEIAALTGVVRSQAEQNAGLAGLVPETVRAVTGVAHKELRSAGFCNPDHLNEPRLYFGLPSFDSDLETNIRVFGSNEPEPYVAGETFPVVKVGVTEDGTGQRAKAHGKNFSGFKTLDYVKCLQPKVVESRLLVWLETSGKRRMATARLKTTMDVELLRVSSQEEYGYIVNKVAKWAQEHDANITRTRTHELEMEKQKTAQIQAEAEKAKAEAEKAKTEVDADNARAQTEAEKAKADVDADNARVDADRVQADLRIAELTLEVERLRLRASTPREPRIHAPIAGPRANSLREAVPAEGRVPGRRSENHVPECHVPMRGARRVRWTATENAALSEGVRMFGLGAWRRILKHFGERFHPRRTNVDLKDRWRTLSTR